MREIPKLAFGILEGNKEEVVVKDGSKVSGLKWSRFGGVGGQTRSQRGKHPGWILKGEHFSRDIDPFLIAILLNVGPPHPPLQHNLQESDVLAHLVHCHVPKA